MWYNFYVNRRDYKNFAKDGIYHVYNRGVNKMEIFKKEKDFKVFLFRLREGLLPSTIDPKVFSKSERRRKLFPEGTFHLLAYCLMPNHFHLMIQQMTDLPVTKLLSKVCTGYSKYFNKEYERVGAVFQDQFKAVLVENNEQLLWASYYIHKNPIEAFLVNDLKDYEWNSFKEYFDYSSQDNLCKKSIIQEQFNTPQSYLNYFESKENEVGNSLQELYFDFDEGKGTMMTIVPEPDVL